MSNIKFSDFTEENTLSNFTGLVGFDTNNNYKISPAQLVTELEDSLYSNDPLPIGQGGTGNTSFGTGFLKASGTQNFAVQSSINLASDVGTSILSTANGGTGVDNYGESVTAVLNTNAVTGGALANPGNSTTHVAPLNDTTVNDDDTLYVLNVSDSVNPQDWNGAIQVKEGGKYLVEAQYASYGNQSGSPEMNMWISVVGGATGNSGYNSAYPTGASVGDIYPWGGGVPSKIENGSAVIRNSQIITISANDYVRIMWRVDGFLQTQAANIYPVYNALSSGMEGYNVELTITKIT